MNPRALAAEAMRRGLLTPPDDRTAEKIKALRDDTFPEQQKFIDDESERIAIGLARRGAKTEGILRKIFIMMLKHAGESIPYGATKINQAKEIVHERIIDLNTRYDLGVTMNLGDHSYSLPNRARLFLFGLNDAAQVNKLRGNKRRMIVVDETQSVRTDFEEFVQSVVNPALMDLRGQLVIGGTPDPKRTNLFWHNAISGKDKRWSRHWWAITANKFLRDPAAYLKKMLAEEGYTEDDPRFRAEFLGDVNAFDESNIMLRDYDRVRNTALLVPAHKFHYFCGYDPGLVDSAAFAVWAYSFVDRRVYLLHTFHRPGMDITEQGAHLVALLEKFPYMTVVADEGALGKLIALELGNRFPNLSFEAAEKTEKALQVKLMNTDFRTSRILVAGTDHIDGTDRKTKTKTGNYAIHDQWTSTAWDEKHQREQEGQPVDLFDAALYGWRACKTYIDTVAPKPVVDTWETAITDHDKGRKVQTFTRTR